MQNKKTTKLCKSHPSQTASNYAEKEKTTCTVQFKQGRLLLGFLSVSTLRHHSLLGRRLLRHADGDEVVPEIGVSNRHITGSASEGRVDLLLIAD